MSSEVSLNQGRDLDLRRRRAAYRANYRGTKEMDWLLGRYAAAHLATMSEPELETFEELLALADPDIQTWLTDAPERIPESRPEPKFGELIGRIRVFHGLPAL